MSLYNASAWGQQTPAAKAMASKRSGRVGGVRSARKRRAKAKAASAPKRRRATKRGKARLVKGSAAAKRYMASIRRKRRK